VRPFFSIWTFPPFFPSDLWELNFSSSLWGFLFLARLHAERSVTTSPQSLFMISCCVLFHRLLSPFSFFLRPYFSSPTQGRPPPILIKGLFSFPDSNFFFPARLLLACFPLGTLNRLTLAAPFFYRRGLSPFPLVWPRHCFRSFVTGFSS